MLWRFVRLTFQRYIWSWPIRPLSFLYIPAVACTTYFGIQAFLDIRDSENEDHEAQSDAAEEQGA